MSAKKIIGTVQSISEQTINIKTERKLIHPKYLKMYKHSNKILVHDEKSTAKVGDVVEVEECRPISKRKAHRLSKVIK